MDKKLLFKTVMMFVALGVVIYGIKTLKSFEPAKLEDNPDSAISLLLGSDLRPLNWCFPQTMKIEIFSAEGALQKTLETPQEISSLCETMIGGVTADKLAQAVFTRRLVAYGQNKEEKILEQTKDGGIFRVQGLPFTSPMLEKALQRIIGTSSH